MTSKNELIYGSIKPTGQKISEKINWINFLKDPVDRIAKVQTATATREVKYNLVEAIKPKKRLDSKNQDGIFSPRQADKKASSKKTKRNISSMAEVDRYQNCLSKEIIIRANIDQFLGRFE